MHVYVHVYVSIVAGDMALVYAAQGRWVLLRPLGAWLHCPLSGKVRRRVVHGPDSRRWSRSYRRRETVGDPLMSDNQLASLSCFTACRPPSDIDGQMQAARRAFSNPTLGSMGP